MTGLKKRFLMPSNLVIIMLSIATISARLVETLGELRPKQREFFFISSPQKS
jgi:hypothetical protein